MTQLSRSLALVALLAACGKDGVGIKDEATQPSATPTEQPTATPSPTPSPTPVDLGYEVSGMFTLPAGSTAPTGDVTVVVQGIQSPEDNVIVLGEVLQSGVAGAFSGNSLPFTLHLDRDEPADDFFVSTEESDAPDEEFATFLIAAFVDDDGDGEHDPGEALVGASFDYLAYLRGGVSQGVMDSGGANGWNRLQFDLVNDGLTATPLPNGATGLDLDANLRVVAPAADLTVTIAAAAGQAVNVDLISVVDPAPIEVTLTTLIGVDATLAGAQGTFGPLPEPPADHLTTVMGDPPNQDPIQGAEVGIYFAVAYVDLNPTNEFEAGDLAVAGSAEGAAPRALFYIQPTDFRAGIWSLFGLNMGWNIVELDDTNNGPPAVFGWGQGMVLAPAPPPLP